MATIGWGPSPPLRVNRSPGTPWKVGSEGTDGARALAALPGLCPEMQPMRVAPRKQRRWTLLISLGPVNWKESFLAGICLLGVNTFMAELHHLRSGG